ncbi:MAG: ORF6N domain-containing protein [Candidatus Omnitrophota bacterium]
MSESIPQEMVEGKIFVIRSHKVMFDKDLADLYGIETRNLNKAVARNIDRFPEDFMFQLTMGEVKNLMFQNGTSSWGGTRKMPRVFTEHGILMLSSVLNSKRAVQVNIQIMRTFIKLRRIVESHKELLNKIEVMEKKYDHQFRVIFEAIKEIIAPLPEKPKRQIGFRAE